MIGKKGADTNTLWIVAGLIIILFVLAITIYFVSGGAFKFSDFFSNLWGKENIDTVKLGCETACTTVSKNAWCNQVRTIRYNVVSDGKLKSNSITCESWVKGTLSDKATAVPQEISEKLEACPTVTC